MKISGDMFGNCLYLFRKFELLKYFVCKALNEPAYCLEPIAEKYVITAFGVGFTIGQSTPTETMAQSIEQVTFEDCLGIFKKIEKAEYLIRLIVNEPTYYLEPMAEKFMIAAFGFGFVRGQDMQTEAVAQLIEAIEKNRDHLMFIYHLSELRRKLVGLEIIKLPVSQG
jgi:hypothetical protein